MARVGTMIAFVGWVKNTITGTILYWYYSTIISPLGCSRSIMAHRGLGSTIMVFGGW